MNSEVNLKRLFIGIPLSSEIKEQLRKIQAELKPLEGLKLVEPENLHLTLKFIGEVKEEKLEKIKAALEKLDLGKKFPVKVRSIGAFPNENYIKVIWFGLEDDTEMADLQKKVDFGLSKMFPVEKEFLSHVTLARVKFVQDKEKLQQFLAKFRNLDLGQMLVEKVVLYESVLKREGPEYKTVEEWGLG